MKTFLKGWVLNSTLNHVQIIPNMMYIWSASQYQLIHIDYHNSWLFLWLLCFKKIIVYKKNRKIVWLTPFWIDPQIISPAKITHYNMILLYSNY